MAENTKIEWCDSTWNPWIGCTKVSPACDHCYAADLSARYGWAKWGAGEPRHRTSPSTWAKPRQWNAAAAKSGKRRSVFCLSLGDWADPEVPPEWRADLFDVIESTPHLDWLLLTKRHALAQRFLPSTSWPHVRVGMTVENEPMARVRLPALSRIQAAGWSTFVSYEPALGPIDWRWWLNGSVPAFGWLIAGGESGASARPAHPDWFRAARDACAAAGVPFMLKQWGEWLPAGEWYADHPVSLLLREWNGSAWGEVTPGGGEYVARIGKARAGRLLDGVLHDAFPEVRRG